MNEMFTSTEIRQQFLDFFKSKSHRIISSAPIVIKNDPTLLFTNAGMNQFKDYFLGNKKAPYPRVADTQKCLRVSGKHNDLEEVGVDTYHHTMFEMLGNWSFGDYFKKEAIDWSWELLTEIYKIGKDRLYVTVFEGDIKESLPKDEEAFIEWKKVIDEARILPGNKKDNFWEMGDTGPCGPCTEIHMDCRTEEERKLVDGKALVNNDHPQVIEIWNIVFIQFNRLKDGNLEPLPSRHVDTGMGFERLVRVLQNKHSNYDTDIFAGTIAEIEKITGKKYISDISYPSPLIKNDLNEIIAQTEKSIELGILNIANTATAVRVITDHLRAISFTVADGQLPSNTGAGYVIRRILRRAIRYYYSYLNYKQPLLFQLVPVLAKQFENVFPELNSQADFVSKVIKEEEEAFLRTLEIGLRRIQMLIDTAIFNYNEEIKHLGYGSTTSKEEFIIQPPKEIDQKISKTHKVIDGKSVFELYDTYGFPLDLTKLIVAEFGLTVDEEGFEAEMQQQKNRSRTAGIIDTEDWNILIEDAFTEFVGYDSLEAKTKVVKYRKVKTKGKEVYQLVLEATPFYAESGGQVGDTGELQIGDLRLQIFDTKKENDLIIQYTDIIPDRLDGEVIAKVDIAKRKATEIHHTATHLLHAALRKVLGTHVTQKGSLVNADHLRFDFSHFSKVTSEETALIESIVNEKIRANIPVVIKEMKKEEAITSGAMALFGEKYGDVVRVVIIDPTYSVELCGGTHVCSTGELGFFKIKHETAVAAGVRRMEAVSGKTAEEYLNEQLLQLQTIREALKNPKELKKSVENLITENSQLKKKIESLEAKQLTAMKNHLIEKIQPIRDINFIGEIVEVNSPDDLKKLSFDLKTEVSNYAIILAANIKGKAFVSASFDDSVVETKKLDANYIIKNDVAPLIKGGGGGQKNLATAGGEDASNLQLVIEKVRSLLL